MKKIISFILFINLFFFYNISTIHAADTDIDLHKINSENTTELKDIGLDNEDETIPKELQPYIPQDKVDKEIFLSLDRLLDKDNFDIMNSKLWLLKAMLYAATPFACGANTLIIAKTSAVTAKLVLAAQFTVPRTIENICFLVDKGRLNVVEGKILSRLQNNFKEIFKHNPCWWLKKAPHNKQKIAKAIWSVIRLGAGMYLAYAYSLIDADTAGDAYKWIYEDATSNKSFLDAAYHVGYILNFCYTAMLGAIFFYQLMDEILMRSCLGYAIGISPPANKDLEYEAYMDYIAELRSRCNPAIMEENAPEKVDSLINEYLSDRNINSMYNIASLQNCLADKEQPKAKCTNIGINVFKILFVGGATALCGVSFKYIFASRNILRNYVQAVGNEISENNYIFKLKNGNNFTCTSINDGCTNNVNFDDIYISDSQKDRLLELNATADRANILQGIAISADTAVLIISAVELVYALTTSKLHQSAFKKGILRKSKIIAAIGASLIVPAMVFYLDNVNNVRPVAKTANKLLKSTGQASFIPVDLGVASTIGVLGATFFLGFRLLSNVPSAGAFVLRKICPDSIGKKYF